MQKFGVLCGCLVLLCKQAKVWLGVLCGFPVKKGISVRTRTSRAVAGCGHSTVRVQGAGAKQTSKGLVICAGAVPSKQARISKGLVWCCAGARCGCGGGAVLSASKGLVLCGCKVAWFGAVLSAKVGCKVKVLG